MPKTKRNIGHEDVVLIAHPLAHPSIQRVTIEPEDPTLFDEWNLAAADTVVDRISAHAQIPRRSVHIKPAGFDDRSLTDVS